MFSTCIKSVSVATFLLQLSVIIRDLKNSCHELSVIQINVLNMDVCQQGHIYGVDATSLHEHGFRFKKALFTGFKKSLRVKDVLVMYPNFSSKENLHLAKSNISRKRRMRLNLEQKKMRQKIVMVAPRAAHC